MMFMKMLVARVALATVCLIGGVTTTDSHHSSIVLADNPPETSEAENDQEVIVNNAEFGIKRINRGKANFIPTTQVPLQEGYVYGWRIQLDKYQGEVKWREVLRLPKAPETWSTEFSEDFSISKDGKTATSKRSQTPVNGVIENFWTIAPGDPVGKHQIEVYIDERLIATFDFEVVEEK
ncbi:hypothetical protein B6N60_00383 [Richelia sinica FACHB-800]|uniref:Uncharacterized protein n=2 Tax=Richelia TaxID=98443 RepID=A0A975Y325_9NOST|nr:hypothetical protein B6N60_00383 [Richelia sinica FACHB-800]